MRLLAGLFLYAIVLGAQGMDREAALGKGLAAEVERQLPLVDNSRVQTELETIVARLRPGFPDYQLPFTIRVVAGDGGRRTHEPIGLPGGYLYVPTTLILEARSEAELAGMLAHSMAHIAARHGLRPERRGAGVPLLFQNGRMGYGAVDLDTAHLPTIMIHSMRLQEYDADRMAVAAMARAGYDPLALAAYLHRTPEAAAWQFRAMPPAAERIDSIEDAVRYLPRVSYTPAGDLAALHQEVHRLVTKPGRKAPSLRRGAIPSPRLS